MSKRYPGGIIRKTPQTPSQTSAQGIWDMASVTQAVKENTWPIAGVPDPISKSLRFRSSASAYLNRTPSSSGNRQTWTYSTWLKRGLLTGSNFILSAGDTTSNNFTYAYFNAVQNNCIEIGNASSGSFNLLARTAAVFRDPSAWYHIVLVFDTTNATSTNRVKLYVNNVLQTLNYTTGPFAQNTNGFVNHTNINLIGKNDYSSDYFDGYLTETIMVDGQALTPSSFGSTNDQTGVWQPIAYTGTYGTNGFYLPFSNTASTATLGYDFSGNSNNWTTNNISLTSGSTYDSMVDVPTQWIPYNTAGDTGALFRGNYCVVNPLSKTSFAIIKGANLNVESVDSSANIAIVGGTFGVTSGKWYWEVTATAVDSNRMAMYVCDATKNGQGLTSSTGAYGYGASGNKIQGDGTNWYGTSSSYGNSWTTNDIIGIALDLDNGKVWFSKNGTWQASGDPAAGTNAAFTSVSGNKTCGMYLYTEASTTSAAFNLGQRPFSYTPPSGFKTLNTTNLSTPTIGATATTTANKYFDATTYTGNGTGLGSTQTISNGNFQPDFIWIKSRSTADYHNLNDSVRGIVGTGSPSLFTNTTDAETTFTGYGVSALTSTGFTLIGNGSYTNNNGTSYVGWQWRASNATAVTNTAGSITSTVSANTTAGFSIVTFTGNSTGGATVGHGLGVAPQLMFVKSRSNAYNWCVYAKAANSGNGQNGGFYLNLTDAWFSDSGFWNNTTAGSSTFTLGSGFAVNNSGSTYVAYCFAEVAGYSAFGSYTGNGSSDGPFVFCGFRPKFVMIKSSSTGGAGYDWFMWDSSRNTYNVIDHALWANLSDAENTTAMVDFVSNGFKLRLNSSAMNGSGTTYIYMAFAESPFKYSLAR